MDHAMNQDEPPMDTTLAPGAVRVGDELPPLHLPPVDRSALALFAGASGDHNPIHLDIDFAQRAGLPDVFAQGMLGMAWLARLLTDWAPQSRLLDFKVRFLAITHVGDALSCSGRVLETFERDGMQCARLAVQATDQDGERKIAGEALVALAHRPAGAP